MAAMVGERHGRNSRTVGWVGSQCNLCDGRVWIEGVLPDDPVDRGLYLERRRAIEAAREADLREWESRPRVSAERVAETMVGIITMGMRFEDDELGTIH